MNDKILVLPWPPKGLSPNARIHWAKKAKITKAYRNISRVLAMQAGLAAPETGRILLVLEFVPPDRRHRDDDGCLASFKAGRDGIADALGIDDKRFVTQFSLSADVVKGGMVIVRIGEAG